MVGESRSALVSFEGIPQPEGMHLPMEERNLPDGFCEGIFRIARRSEGKRGTRSKATRTSVSEQQRSQTENTEAKSFAKDFSEGRDVTKKSEERVVKLRGRTFRGTAKRFGKKPKQKAL